ncbi:MAG: histidine kinase [Lewinellaceae bacterium]|nr:histidine kinase [Lewinellaceae bacterium]
MKGRIVEMTKDSQHFERDYLCAINSSAAMKIMGKGKLAHPMVRYLFLLFFWAVWLALPFIMIDGDDTQHRDLFVKILPASFTNVILFFIIAEWLGPRLLSQQRLITYLLTVLVLSLLFIVGQGFMKNWLLFPEHKGFVFHMFRGMVQVFFAAALGTGYALVRYTLREEKSRQEEQRERLQSELSFLRSQISPHFLFNILNSIVYLIRSKSAQAEPVTLQLSALMRYMLYESDDAQIPLEKEIGYLKNYVDLQKIRFEEDVEIRLNIEGQAAAQVIEPMLMIPFVENAFKHGIGLVQLPVIDILVKMTEKHLSFVVRNKITPEATEDKDSSSGIGLQNVRRRLELLYPDAHELEIGEKDGWFEARLSIDFQA